MRRRAFAAAWLLVACVDGFVPAAVRRRPLDGLVSRAGASKYAEVSRDRRDPLALERDTAPHHAVRALDVDLGLARAAPSAPAAPIADDDAAAAGLGAYWTPRLGLLGLAWLRVRSAEPGFAPAG